MSNTNTCRFGKILLGNYFKFQGVVWKREHGKSGQIIKQIGMGNGTRCFNVEDIVEPVDKGEYWSNLYKILRVI